MIFMKNQIKKKKVFFYILVTLDYGSVFNLITTIKPDEIYNLSAQSHVAVSFEIPEYTANTNALELEEFWR